VQINYGYSWFDFSNVPAQNVTTGLPTTFNYLQAENIQLGTDMTTSQLEALILLHEFKHTPAGGNAPQEAGSANNAFNPPIYHYCIAPVGPAPPPAGPPSGPGTN
jgi:hypothetical protein